MTTEPTPTGQAAADAFNAAHPVGTVVHYWPITRDHPHRAATTRTPAWVMPSGDAVVSVDGHRGGIALTHVDVVVPASPTEADNVRVARIMAIVTPLGYGPALALLNAQTAMLEAAARVQGSQLAVARAYASPLEVERVAPAGDDATETPAGLILEMIDGLSYVDEATDPVAIATTTLGELRRLRAMIGDDFPCCAPGGSGHLVDATGDAS